ncbi:MAG: molybdenum cofactor biosynthesis protein [Candidatus Omnitrophica bacterium]|nr:molybdenum cofactor biosynthesis protein [Candidatus Omnitrophota bacterium]
MGKIKSIYLGAQKGELKKKVNQANLRKEYGIIGDVHAGAGSRQISLLAEESIAQLRSRDEKIGAGNLMENLRTSGIELTSLLIGTKLKIDKTVLLEVTEIGKHSPQSEKVFAMPQGCLMPLDGIFARVLSGGMIKEGDTIKIVADTPITAGILIISDRSARGERPDKTGSLIAKGLNEIKITPVRYKIIPDEEEYISLVLSSWTDEGGVDLIVTSGGTGFFSRDVTPEATKRILDKEAGGLAEMMRTEGAKRTKRAYLSRGVAGIRKKTLIVNLPGNPQGARESLEIISPILSHAIKVIKGTPCEEIK